VQPDCDFREPVIIFEFNPKRQTARLSPPSMESSRRPDYEFFMVEPGGSLCRSDVRSLAQRCGDSQITVDADPIHMNIRLKKLEKKWKRLRKEEGFRQAPVLTLNGAWFPGWQVVCCRRRRS